MTVTLVFGKTSDGYLSSFDASYTNARNGPADTVSGGNLLYIGQNNNAGQYAGHEAFVGYDYAAIPATEVVTCAQARLYVSNILNTSLAVDVRWRGGYTWSAGGLTTGDWRTPAQLTALRDDGLVHLLSGAKNKIIQTSSDELLAAVKAATSIEHVVFTNRFFNGNTPTSDEGIAIPSADEVGTTYDPCLVYTSVPLHTLFGVLGAQVRLTDGWAYLESNGAASPTINLKHRADGTGTVTTIAAVPLGTGGTQFSVPAGAQALALVADPSDNLYILGKLGSTENSLAILAYQRGGGVTWTAKTMRSTAMPVFGASINQVVAAYHNLNGGAILAFVEHVGSAGDSVTHNEMSHASFNLNVLLTNATGSSPINGSGYSMPQLQPIVGNSSYFNTWHNETGTGMDVANASQAGGSADWGYVYSFGTSQSLGGNDRLYEGRYILASTAATWVHRSTQDTLAWGRKDAGAKLRIVPISATAAAFLSTDSDAGYGITVSVRNHSGTTSGSTEIGHDDLSGEGILNMPDGPALGQVSSWDAVYNSTENTLWIYYVDSTDAGRLRRTSYDLNTMQMTLSSVLVYDDPGAATISSVRVQRNAPVTQNTLVTIALNNAGVLSTAYVVDTFNAAPNAPVLTTKSNFDATTAQTFSWSFTDPNPGDTQSAYQLEISRVSDGVVVLDTGKVVSSTPSRLVSGGTISNGFDYRWRVRTWDALDAQGPYSGYGLFTASAGGTVTITSPATDNPLSVVTDDLPITWSVTGTTQAAYRIWLYRGTTLVSDTNWIASTATSATISGMLSDQAHEIRVQVRNASNVTTNTASRFLTPSFSTPEKPLITVQQNADEGYVLVSIENPAPGAPAAGFTEWGFESGVTGWTGTNGTLAQDVTLAHRDTASAKLTVTGTPVQAYARPANVAVTPGTRYTARMWVYRSTAGKVTAAIDWASVATGYVSTSAVDFNVAATTWTPIEVTGTCPATADRAGYGPTLSASPATGTSVNFDEVVLTIASDRPDVSSNSILRRKAGTSDPWEVVGSTKADGTFRDYTAGGNVSYEYRARGNA